MRKLATLMFVLAAAGAADAKPKAKGNVKVHMDKAAKAHKAGKFDVALTELQAAYAIDPQPKLLFAIAQVHAKLDDCEQAIEYYEKFAASTKDKAKQSVVKQAIDACKKKLDDAKDKSGGGVFRAKKPPAENLPTAETKPEADPEPAKVETAPEPAKIETPPEPKPEPKPQIKAFDDPPPPPKPAPEPVEIKTTTEPTHSPWYRDPLGDALVITGVGATIASVLVFRSAQNDVDTAENESANLAEYEQHRNDAERKELYTWILAGGGIALVSAGVLRYVIRDNHKESRGVAVVPTRDGGFITWSGGF